MSGLYRVSEQINIARQWVGFHEGYDNRQPFSYWQYGDATNSWCVSFASYCAYHAGYRFYGASQYGEKGDSSCYYLRIDAMRWGIWKEGRNHTANPGWIVIFGNDEHAETVITDNGVTILTIGGNTSNGVYYRLRYRSTIRGFVALDQSGQNLSEDKTKIYPSKEVNMSVLVPAGAHVEGGRLPFYKVDASADHIACYNGAALKWKGTVPGKDPKIYTTAKRLSPTCVVYKIPQNAPHVEVEQVCDPVTLKPQKVGVVLGADGGCAFFDIVYL